ncbi:Fungal specific transcription factor domain-containing protein isoform 1 [Cladophialophora immunda]|nr:Fungal specific transcription factor domain-containing protein isoform 1 [Cladophialophora immunda]
MPRTPLIALEAHDVECVYSRPLPSQEAKTVETLERRIQELTLRLKQAEEALSHSKQDDHPAQPRGLVRDSIPFPGASQPHGSLASKNSRPINPATVALAANETRSHLAPLRSMEEQEGSPTPDAADLNVHTQGWEYYGPSSPIAFLRKIPGLSEERSEYYAEQTSRSFFASLLHNSTFPLTPAQGALTHTDSETFVRERLYFRVSRKFIDAYFDNLHHIQPALDQERFMTRCEELWFGAQVTYPSTFIALYYSVLSLGALLAYPKSGKFHGLEHFEWSRILFREACEAVLRLGHYTNLDMVQCYYMMAKIAQHELNPHITYLYTGQAIRIALSIGLNRESPASRSAIESCSTESSQTWWSLYCLDVQTSFALGRPDGLGPDAFHTCYIPGSSSSTPQDAGNNEDASIQILPAMVSFSRVMRRVGSELYATQYSLVARLKKVVDLAHDLEQWLAELPSRYQESGDGVTRALKSTLSVSCEEKQRIVVWLRYHNLRMVIHSSVIGTVPEKDLRGNVQEHWELCINSAMRTIQIIHETFLKYNFFQTWSYNSTYILFAVTILFIGVFHPLCCVDSDLILDHVNQAIVVLDAVEETVVTRKAIAIITETLARAKDHCRHAATLKSANATLTTSPATLSDPSHSIVLNLANGAGSSSTAPSDPLFNQGLQSLGVNGLNFVPGGYDFETSSFWAEWAQSLGGVTDMNYGYP